MQLEPRLTDSAYRSSDGQSGDRLAAVLQEIEYLNTIGKRFVAAVNRFQVHRALMAALRELYSFSACAILLKGEPAELSIIPCYPLSAPFLQAMFVRITNAANVMDFPPLSAKQIAETVYLDAPDELSPGRNQETIGGSEIGSCLNIPLTVEDRIIGLLSLVDEQVGTFDTNLLKLTTMIADYAAVALENVRLRERERALWKQAELERQRLELIISSMAEGLLITNAEGTITSLNQSAQQLLTQAHLDLRQPMPLRELAITSKIAWLSGLAEIVSQALAGEKVLNQELIVGASGDTVPLTLSVSAAPLPDASYPSAPPLGVVAVLNDVTSNKQIEKLKDEFVSVVSHELRTPLTAIKGYTQHLVRRIERRLRKARQEEGPSVVEMPESYDLHSLYIVQSQTAHLERLVSDLLDLSRVQWGQLHLHYSQFYLADLLAECVRAIQVSAELHTIFLDIQVTDTRIMADKRRVNQVLGNLLDNAVKYSPHGGRVTVKLEEQAGDFLVSVVDEGMGVSQEYFDHIFERFYRVRNTASRQYAGIGLGLFVAKAIIEAHGGTIGFMNNQGMGCTFYFRLSPLPPTTQEPRP